MLTVKPPSIRELISSALSKGHGIAEIMERFKHSVLVYALEVSGGDWIKAANVLQVGFANFQIRMEESGLDQHFPRNGMRRA